MIPVRDVHTDEVNHCLDRVVWLEHQRTELEATLDRVREWAMVNEIAAVPLDWTGLDAILNPAADS